ncbi:MAG: GlcG/HbpS family heme-binding protein [Candidatus Promineifilaceae bacterium]|jgi:glc operon protein GlcG
MYETAQLSLHDALALIDDVREVLERDKLGAAVAVVDAHGELIAFVRTEGCPLPSINNAVHKAFTAAREGKESGAVGQASREEGFAITNFGDLRYTGWGGGVPITFEGQVLGAVGISGLPEADDVALARHAAATWKASPG